MAGTAGGTILVIFMQITNGEMLQTAVMAAVGAIVSFAVSVGLKCITRRFRKIKIQKQKQKTNGKI